jgi:hypothetical protein
MSTIPYQLTNGFSILYVPTGACIPTDPSNSDYQAYLAWIAAGNTPSPAPVLTIPQLANDLETGVQIWLDAAAQANGYSGMDSCISYYNSSIAQWAADAKAGLAWRDAVWTYCFAAQTNPQFVSNPPTLAQLLTELPQPAEFGWVTHAPGASATPSPTGS